MRGEVSNAKLTKKHKEVNTNDFTCTFGFICRV